MNRLNLCVVAFGFSLSCFAAVQESRSKVELTPAQKEAASNARRQRIEKTTGGFIFREGAGKIVFVNCQSDIEDKVVNESVTKIRLTLKFNRELIKSEWKFGQAKPKDATIAIYLVNDESLPMSLIAVEAGWGVVNVKGLKLGSRFSKELSRVVALTCGGGYSQLAASPLRTVTSPGDLDKRPIDGFTIDSANAIFANMKELGVTRYMKVSYKKACQEGWAPQPTNEVQKAIWDKVHALPTEPLKINPETKKVER